jgi:hypothetical protein
MVPDHNTELWEFDDEDDDGEGSPEEEAAPTADTGLQAHTSTASNLQGCFQQQQQRQQQRSLTVRGVRLPLRLNTLVVESLGEVNFMHPKFHDEKQIWPVGYVAKRLARTPASGMEEVWHKVEVLEAKDGSGPLFR